MWDVDSIHTLDIKKLYMPYLEIDCPPRAYTHGNPPFSQVLDHKRLRCDACPGGDTVITAYSAYHTDAVRKHFLRHHEVRGGQVWMCEH